MSSADGRVRIVPSSLVLLSPMYIANSSCIVLPVSPRVCLPQGLVASSVVGRQNADLLRGIPSNYSFDCCVVA